LDSRLYFNQCNNKVIETGEKQCYQLEIIRAEGELFRAFIETTPIIDEENNFKAFQMSIIDLNRFNGVD